jgi:ubiquinone/menaquinone biosynthesis C-methylase UbiE/DNA-binding MarR family transcriptional regulator
MRSPTLADLADEVYLDKSTTSRVVDSLVRKGYARRVPEPGDGRVTRIEATREGMDLYTVIDEHLIEQEKKLIADLEPGVRQATARVIARLARLAKDRLSREDGMCCDDVRKGDDMDVKKEVRETYAQAARRVRQIAGGDGEKTSCCGSKAPTSAQDAITTNLYEGGELDGVPEEAVLASLGCGNPAALAELAAGEVVLDLGSGGGIDVILSAKRVGPTGKALGLDMTDEMLEIARENQRKAGVENVEFLKGDIESIPLPDSSVDVIISNCVINLSADKPQVLREAFRILKPGGRFAVSDIVSRGPIPDELRHDMEMWTGCIAGALEENEYRSYLRDAGFESIEIEPTRVFRIEQGCCGGTEVAVVPESVLRDNVGVFMSAFIRASKPR